MLLSAEALPNQGIATRVTLSPSMVEHKRRQWRAHWLAGLYDVPQSGLSCMQVDDTAATMLRTVVRSKSKAVTQWRVRLVAGETWISKARCSATSRCMA